jgi:hypothetical protein
MSKNKVWIQASRESRKELAVARRKVPRREKVSWRKRNIARKVCNRAIVIHEIQRGRTFGRRRQQEPECSNGIRSRGVEEQVHLRKGRKTSKSIGGRRRRHQPRLESMGNGNKFFGKTIHKASKLDSSGLQRMMDWTLWRGRPPPKRKKRPHREEEPVM